MLYTKLFVQELWAAIASGNQIKARKLLEDGVVHIDHQYTAHLQQTALHAAVQKGSLECVATLIEHGASLTIPDQFGRTALQLVADSLHSPVLNCLVAAVSSTMQSLQDKLDAERLRYTAVTRELAQTQKALLQERQLVAEKNIELKRLLSLYDEFRSRFASDTAILRADHRTVLTTTFIFLCTWMQLMLRV